MNKEVSCLERSLQNFPYNCQRLARMKDAAEADPDNSQLQKDIETLQFRISRLSAALSTLSYEEMEMFYYHFEAGIPYRQMEEQFHYSYRGIHDIVRRIMIRLIQNDPYII